MKQPVLIGAILGDILGSPYEFNSERNPEKISFTHPLRYFTDDTVLTLAVAKAIVEQRPYRDTIYELALNYPDRGFGGRFYSNWIANRDPRPYNSLGNGAAMRVSPIGWAFNTIDDVLREAEASAACSHNHPFGIQSAQAVALAIFLARKGQDKETIAEAIESRFEDFVLTDNLELIRAQALMDGFDETWASVPPAISVFLATDSFESCLREAIALGCDADTQACIAGSIAEAYYGVEPHHTTEVMNFLDPALKRILSAFSTRYGV